MSRQEQEVVASPGAWLSKVTGRIRLTCRVRRGPVEAVPAGVVWRSSAPDEDQTLQWLHAQQAAGRLLQSGQHELVNGRWSLCLRFA
jgi:hypothetical protein